MDKNKMGHMPMTKLIISMSLPAMFSMLVGALYNIVDSMFVARISQDALTAVSLAFPVQNLMIAIGVGTAIGINSLISRRLGEKRFEEANDAATHGILLGFVNWVIFIIIGLFFTKAFFDGFTGNQNIVQMGTTYTSIVTVLSAGVFIQINIEKMLQATGNMIYPMVMQLTGAIINIILDPIMIFGWFGFPAMGVAGAALATVIGQFAGLGIGIYVLIKKEHAIHVSFKGFKLSMKTIKDIYSVGFPSIIMQSISSLLIVCMNAILISFSEAAVSVLGVYYKVQSFIFMPVFGLTQGVMPIMGYNFGAKNKQRLVEALKTSSIIAVLIMLAGSIMFLTIPDKLLLMFDASEELLAIGVPAFRTICLCFIPAALGIMCSTLFQAVGMGTKSLIVSFIRQMGVILPCAYIFSKIGLSYVWYAFPISEGIALVLSAIMLYVVYNSKLRYLEDSDIS